MRKYELTVLIHPDLEADLETQLGTVRGIITNNKGTVVSEDSWGKKKLAYPIAKENFAVYVYLEIELPAEAVAKVDSTLNITDSVIRHLLVAEDVKAKAAALEAAKAAKDSKEVKEEE